MAEAIKITAKTFEGRIFLRKVLAAMRGSPAFQNRIMKGMGALALGYAQSAFDKQSLGSELWKERYPKQTGAKVNVAGIVSDFIAGKNPPERRFEARPAGIDEGKLKRSLVPSKAMTVDGFSVTVGSVEKHAGKVQFGGESEQPLTKSVTDKLAEYMKKSRGRVKRAKKKSQPVTKKDAAIAKLGFLFHKAKTDGSLKTKSVPRPYLGVTTELEEKLIAFIVEEFEEEFDEGMNTVKRA